MSLHPEYMDSVTASLMHSFLFPPISRKCMQLYRIPVYYTLRPDLINRIWVFFTSRRWLTERSYFDLCKPLLVTKQGF